MSDELAFEKRYFGHRARLVLTPAQSALIDDQAHAARAMWNLLHEWWTMLPKHQRSLTAADVAIRRARKEIDWLAALPAQGAQAVLRTYYRAWKNCWEGRADEPRFKARYRTPMSVDLPQGEHLKVARVHRRWGMVNITKVGRVRFHWSKDLPVGKLTNTHDRISGARLVKDALGWHIAFRVQSLIPKPEPHPGPQVGIDMGVKVPLALSDGTAFRHDSWLNGPEREELLRLERQAEHRKRCRHPGEKTSRRLQATYNQIRALHARAKRRRLNWQHQITTAIARTYGTVVVERLHITAMLGSAKGTVEEPGRCVPQKSGLNRAISEQAWGRTIEMLAYKTAHNGGSLIKVPAADTSRRCSMCGLITPGSRESQAVFVCKNADCGWSGNADHNAACNILHLYRAGHALAPVAGRRSRQARKRVEPTTAR